MAVVSGSRGTNSVYLTPTETKPRSLERPCEPSIVDSAGRNRDAFRERWRIVLPDHILLDYPCGPTTYHGQHRKFIQDRLCTVTVFSSAYRHIA